MKSDLEQIKLDKIEKKVYRLRHRDGLSWNDVSKKIIDEDDIEMTSKKAQNLYDKHISKAGIISSQKKNFVKEARAVDNEWKVEMKDLLDTIKEKALKHLEIADKLLIEQADEGNTNAYFRNLPSAIAIWRNLVDQINVISKRQEKIELNQKNYILNETQVLQIVNNAYKKKAKETGWKVHPGTGLLVRINKEE